MTFNPDCLRRVANWSKITPTHKFDKKTFKPKDIAENLQELSPKMAALLNNIQELDAADMSKYGKHFKHFIFSDVKQGGYGSKVITSAMIASGYTLGYDNALRLVSDSQLLKTKGKNVVLMSSTSVFDDAMKVSTKKEIFAKYNSRPDNVNGDLIRFIVMDSGFKEGIDLFDIKYVHVFEPQTSKADMKQVVGRGTRTCGQKGLEFHPTQGWPLRVFLYDVSIPNEQVDKLGGQDTMFKMYIQSKGIDVRKMRLADELERYSIIGSVDYELNNNIHNFELEDDTDYFNIIFDGGAGTRVRVKPTEVICEGKCGSVRQTRDVPLGTAVLAAAYFALKKELPKKEKKPRAFFCAELKSDPKFCQAAKEIYTDPISFVKRYAEEIIKSIERKRHLMLPPHVRASMFRFVFGIIPKPMKLKPLVDDEVTPNGPLGNSPSPQRSPSPNSTKTPSPEQSESPVVSKTPEQLTYDYKQTFLGVREYVRENFTHLSWPKVKLENMCGGPNMKPKQVGGAELMKLTPTQEFVSTFFTPQATQKGMLLWHSVGTGKCWAKDTPILMFDGSIKKVQDMKVGDIVMGDDATPRNVLSLGRGRDDMFDIVPDKGEKYTVNSEHILCLKPTRLGVFHVKKQTNLPYCARWIDNKTGMVRSKSFETQKEANAFLDGIHQIDNVLEIEVKDFLKLSKSSQKCLKGYRVGVDFPSRKVLFDPYIIGYWLGDGSQRDPVISSQESVVLRYVRDHCIQLGLSLNHQSGYDYRISSLNRGSNTFLKALHAYQLINNKHIPSDYKTNDRTTRLQLLAGIIDSDGTPDNRGYNIIQKNKMLTGDILYLARSLGFAAYAKECKKSCMYKGQKREGTYQRISIFGYGVHEIPVKVPRKLVSPRTIDKNHLVTGIEVKHVGKGDYYGFTLDGNNRLLLGDFTVTHNTCAAIATATTTFEKQGYTILWVTRTTLKSDIWKNMFDQVCSAAMKDKFEQDANFKIPADMTARMGLLSKSWSIRPMSYKQFSNLVSGSNDMYKQLVKKNGAEDPLRKTLLIIDEAHKLYGGTDLSSVERPDMNKLHDAIMKSYRVSGPDSVRLLLMTATPFTNDPLELIKLLNLCRPINHQIPDEYDAFSAKYLAADGSFTKRGSRLYLDDIAGHISYLNREKDARQFAQPIITPITVEASVPQDGKTSDEIKEEYEVMLVDLTDQLKSSKEDLSTKRKEVMKAKKDQRDTCKNLKKQERVDCMERVAAEIKRIDDDYELSKQEHDAIAADLKAEMKNVRDLKKAALKANENNMSQMSILTSKCVQVSKTKKKRSPTTNSSP